MKNYRNAFVLVLVVNILIVGAVAGFWWNGRRAGQNQHAPVPVSSPAAQPAHAIPPSLPVTPNETPLVPVQLSAERLQSIGVKFGVVERKNVRDEVRTTGTVAMDETRLSYVQTRISGHIEKVFVDATYQYVRKGQPLFTIHSPELVVAEREYLLAKQNEKNLSQSTVPGVSEGVATLLDSSVERLHQWSIPQAEIERLKSTGQVADALEIDSPVSGYIIERNALSNLAVQPETRLYSIADLSTVWVLAQVFQNDLGRIRVGASTTLSVDSYPGRTFSGKVDFIYPDVDVTTRTARVRLVVSNPDLTFKPGMYVNVVVAVALGNQLVIPVSGVLQSGTRQIVFVDKGDGSLEPREVQLGPQAGDEYIVLKGLKPGEHIVTSANFLIDSESQLQAAIASFAPASPGAATVPAAKSPATQATTKIEFSSEPATPRKGSNLYRVKLAAADGSPLTGAQVSVRSFLPGMPQMGMAPINLVTPLIEKGGGIYEGQANLESAGTWQLSVTAIKDGAVLGTKQISLSAEGGM